MKGGGRQADMKQQPGDGVPGRPHIAGDRLCHDEGEERKVTSRFLTAAPTQVDWGSVTSACAPKAQARSESIGVSWM